MSLCCTMWVTDGVKLRKSVPHSAFRIWTHGASEMLVLVRIANYLPFITESTLTKRCFLMSRIVEGVEDLFCALGSTVCRRHTFQHYSMSAGFDVASHYFEVRPFEA